MLKARPSSPRMTGAGINYPMNKINPGQNGRLRLGGTSCTVDGDITSNVRLLAPFVDDVELIFYEYEGANNFPDRRSLQTLLELKAEYNLTYTVHLPSRLGAGPLDAAWQKRWLRLWESCIINAQSLDPFAYIWHWDAERFGPRPAADMRKWRLKLSETADAFLNKKLTEPAKLCVENLSFDFEPILPLVLERGLSVCLDMGHWWNNRPPGDTGWQRCLAYARVVHLHGVKPKERRDHIGLQEENLPQLKLFAEHLDKQLADGKERTLTLEVFSLEDLQSSLKLWRQLRETAE